MNGHLPIYQKQKKSLFSAISTFFYRMNGIVSCMARLFKIHFTLSIIENFLKAFPKKSLLRQKTLKRLSFYRDWHLRIGYMKMLTQELQKIADNFILNLSRWLGSKNILESAIVYRRKYHKKDYWEKEKSSSIIQNMLGYCFRWSCGFHLKWSKLVDRELRKVLINRWVCSAFEM